MHLSQVGWYQSTVVSATRTGSADGMPSYVRTYVLMITGWLPLDCTRSPLLGHDQLQWLQVLTQSAGEHNASGSCTITVEATWTSKAHIYSITIENTSSSVIGSVHINHNTECSLLPVQLSSAVSVDGIVCWSKEFLSSGFWLLSPLQWTPAQLPSTLHNICSCTISSVHS